MRPLHVVLVAPMSIRLAMFDAYLHFVLCKERFLPRRLGVTPTSGRGLQRMTMQIPPCGRNDNADHWRKRRLQSN
jgi:hypothetical protein